MEMQKEEEAEEEVNSNSNSNSNSTNTINKNNNNNNNNILSCWTKRFFTVRNLFRLFFLLLFSQFLSLCLTTTGIFSTLLQHLFQAHIPTLQSTPHYFLLFVVYGTLLRVSSLRVAINNEAAAVVLLQSDPPSFPSPPLPPPSSASSSSNSSLNKSSSYSYSNSYSNSVSLCNNNYYYNNNSNNNNNNNIGSDNDSSSPATAASTPLLPTSTTPSLLPKSTPSTGPPSWFRIVWKSLRLRIPFWKYFVLAIFDVEANYVVVKAYQYTSITSVMLLNCFTIPCVMVLSRIFLKTRYRVHHFVGVVFCLSGLILLIISDYRNNNDNHNNNGGNSNESRDALSVVFGDLLCIASSVLYALSNVGQELVVNHNQGGTEYLAMIGLFGFLINATQLIILEHNEIFSLQWNTTILLLITGFSLTLFTFYTLVPQFLRVSNATFMNLSFLTSNFFAVLANIFLFHQMPNWLFSVAFVIILSGLCVYNLVQPSIMPSTVNSPENSSNSVPTAEPRSNGRDPGLYAVVSSDATSGTDIPSEEVRPLTIKDSG